MLAVDAYICYSCITPDYYERAKSCFEPEYSFFEPQTRYVIKNTLKLPVKKAAAQPSV